MKVNRHRFPRALPFLLAALTWAESSDAAMRDVEVKLRLTPQAASSFALLALECVQREYPNKPGHVINDESDILSPRALHPAFYGCYDWHSAVHGHWMLVRLLRLYPGLPEGDAIRRVLDENITADNIRAEVAYFDQPNRKSFERTYGWAWLLKLAAELHTWDDPDGGRWSANLSPLTRAIVGRYMDFLPRQTYPIRTGVHPNTAFGIAFAWDYAHAVGNVGLREILVERSMAYYGADATYPAAWEPGGEDFFSPSLMEADLMRRVMRPAQFTKWFDRFLPDLASGESEGIPEPAIVADRTDPKIVHLDGLNLSRAWCMIGIAMSLPQDHASRAMLFDSAMRHAQAALAYVSSGHYEGEHWLASFAVYLLSRVE
ncbi:MAG: DUF2891 domain-containing protein [Candidatus Krumholzibacteria bacterium]|nr:DUF2891 domain-containing protein [Candidatus Krumholzibacteria bacterium]